jgi:pyruvate, water dikinase
MSNLNQMSADINEIGGKAYGLGVLAQLGYKVPEYIVVSSNQDTSASDLIDTLNAFTSKFSRMAVRSSANIEDGKKTSFAGQFNSYLDVPTDQVIDRIEDVRKSVKTEHVKRYCEVMGLSVDDIKMNAIVQRFDEPVSGGVWMGNGLLGGRLEWVEGRGDKVVNGESTPFYESYGEKGQLLDKNTEQVLTDQTGKSVAEYCKEIQSQIDYEADLEFCITKEGIQWLQLRRVTIETGESANHDKSLPQQNIIKGEAASAHKAQGSAYRLDQKHGSEWSSGKILVARATSPNDMMYIMTSAGVVTKMGGMLSHSAVVCRELGKACVVGVDIDKIENGNEILVDGILGEVHLL